MLHINVAPPHYCLKLKYNKSLASDDIHPRTPKELKAADLRPKVCTVIKDRRLEDIHIRIFSKVIWII